MRIAISFLNFRPGVVAGAETYLRHLLAFLPQVKGDDDVFVVGHRGNAETLQIPGINAAIVDKKDLRVVMARLVHSVSFPH